MTGISQKVRTRNAGNGVCIVTLDDDASRNSISDLTTVNELVAALETLNHDAEVRVIILTGAGKAFSSGGNLKTIDGAEGVVDPEPAVTRERYRAGIQRLPLLFEKLDVPVIAAVNGAAIGAGCDLACMCDIRLAAGSAFFAESFVTLGLIPGDGGAWLLPRIVGFARASEMALTGRRVDAAEAVSFGLVSRVVPDDQLMEAAFEIAELIASNPPAAVRMTRRLLREAQHSRLESVLELSAALQALAHTTQDHKDALAAFRNRNAAPRGA